MPCLAEHLAQQVALRLAVARKAVLGRECQRRNYGYLEVGVVEIFLCRGGGGGEIILHQLPAHNGDVYVFFLRKLHRNGDAVGEYVALYVGHLLGKVHGGGPAVDKDARALVNKGGRLLRDDDLRVHVHGRLFGVSLAGNFLHFFNGHCAAANTYNAPVLFELGKVAAQGHLRYVGECFFKLFKRHLAAFVEQFGNFFQSFAFHFVRNSFVII